MKATSYRAFAACLLVAAVCARTATAQTVAVDFGGDYTDSNRNSDLDESDQLQVDTGDFNGDSVSDARTFIPVDHTGFFIGGAQLTNAGQPGVGGTSVIHAGMQITNYGSATPSDVSLFRYAGGPDFLQMTTTAQAGGATSQGMAFLPHVRKDNFLNSLAGATELSFSNTADSFDLSYFWNTNVVASTPPADEQLRRGRLMVQNGSQWYISESRVGSKGSNAAPNVISINAATETWFPIDLSSTMYYTEVGGGDTTPNSANIGAGVLGSTFNDIQALGAHLILTNFDGTAINAGQVAVQNFGASLDAVLPPPPTPDPGIGIVAWDMETITPGVSTTDQFSNTFTGDAVIDGTGTPNPGLIAGEMNDPLILGDVTPGGSLGPIPPSTVPAQTVGGMGFGGGEALSFDGIDDEAIAITGWLADSSETLFIPGLEGVYVEVDFKEVSNTGQGVQNIASGGSVWRLQIDDDGNLEWLTFLEGGGNDTIEVPLGAEGDWREVQAFHNADGSKGLFLDGVLVAQSFPGQLHIDRHSILLGNLENTTNYYEGLIDNVFVGGGAPIPGDFDFDGDVDGFDFLEWQRNPAVGDLADWEANYGTSALQANGSVVPEPNTVCLLLGLSLGLLTRRKGRAC